MGLAEKTGVERKKKAPTRVRATNLFMYFPEANRG
jgi:hypothetical protein